MLQQTTAAVVAKRWIPFLTVFPSIESLATATEEQVLVEWSGLGYYSRARNLKRAAEEIVRTGKVPLTEEGWARLPGIGAYTAAAISSICFGQAAAVVDGNVARVLSRIHALKGSLKSSAAGRNLQSIADALLDPRSPGDHNQALMEVGATVCTPRSPRCAECPLKPYCKASLSGKPEEFPQKGTPRVSRRIGLAAGIWIENGALRVVPDEEFVKGHWSVPTVRVPGGHSPETTLREAWPAIAGGRVVQIDTFAVVNHSVLDRRYRAVLFRVTVSGEAGAEGRWVPLDQLGSIVRGGFLLKVRTAHATRRPFSSPAIASGAGCVASTGISTETKR